MHYEEDERQYGRDWQEMAEMAAWNALKSLNDLNELEANYPAQKTQQLRALMTAIDAARANLRDF